ncbi:ribonuclease Z [Flavobacterium sp.]|uniref:ribonuclease Z n=1 Tax=Flavobacterium sp. TaxID=239 RepID=UPI0026184B8E|nr:ribonuclease Z [Flavobacterium sp.]
MRVETKGHTTILRDTVEPVADFCAKVTREYGQFVTQNVIVDLTHIEVDLTTVKLFSPLAKTHQKGKKSFVIVVNAIDFNAIPSHLHVVPSLKEAHDIIEMEEIERDLGF